MPTDLATCWYCHDDGELERAEIPPCFTIMRCVDRDACDVRWAGTEKKDDEE